MAFKISGSTIIDDTRKFSYYAETLNTIGNTTASTSINFSSGNFVTATLATNTTFTFTTPPAGAFSFTLVLTNDAVAARTIVWPASVRWPGGTSPTRTTTANRTDVYTFWTINAGTTWYGTLVQYNYA
jgi:hypothetical protein